jgi:hypothetical protein
LIAFHAETVVTYVFFIAASRASTRNYKRESS